MDKAVVQTKLARVVVKLPFFHSYKSNTAVQKRNSSVNL
ncbi:putative 40s ribosomal protein S28 [Schistosoma mansoni]|nr:putative 40s ribosomal protein S28 [Schistosoma mansoni]|eukprot:XP_018652570.1 putative 40s ribosomal protein S28 [Schistosoma mansoni]